MRNYLLLVLFVMAIPNSLWAQDNNRMPIKGKVKSGAYDLSGIIVINSQSEEQTTTTTGGYFSIRAASGDTLLFSSVQFNASKVLINEDNKCQELLLVPMTFLMNQLQEVVVYQYKNINAVALGIIPKGQKTYSPAQQRLKTATDYDAKIGLNTSLMIDPLLNLFSGRTAMLEKEVVVEKKEFLMAKVEEQFSVDFCVNTLKIPVEYVKGFHYYVVENTSFVKVLETNNKVSTAFLLGELAVEYKKIIGHEN